MSEQTQWKKKMKAVIKDCWYQDLNEDECFEVLKNYSIFSEKWKTVQMICRVYNALNEQMERHIEDVSFYLLEQQL